MNYIAQREGGFDKLKGKKIATVYDSAYGRETLGPLKLLAEKYGFEEYPDSGGRPATGGRRNGASTPEANPDWVFLRTQGVSTPVAVKTAARFGFPVDHIVGDIWASSSERVARRRRRQRLPGANAIPGRSGFRDPQTPQAVRTR